MNPYRFNLVTLALIAAVVRAGSISGGAKALNMAIAAASKRLTDFEEQLGVTLFYRRSNGVETTEAGRALFQNIVTVLDDINKLASEISEFASGARGQIRVWATPPAISQSLPDDLSRFILDNPGVRIDLDECDSVDVIKAVLDNRADIGVFAETSDPSGLETFVYRQEELVLVVPKDHVLAKRKSVTFARALEHDFIGLLPGTPLAARVEYESRRIGSMPSLGRLQVRGVEAMCRMIGAGIGIGISPRDAVGRHLKALKLETVALSDPWAKRNSIVGVRDVKSLPSPVRLLLSHLVLPVESK